MYNLIAIAGTFDKLHKGHQYFISQAFKLGQRVLVGLTSDAFVKAKFKVHPDSIGAKFKVKVKNYIERKKELEEFLTHEKLLNRAEIVEIDDVYGPTIDEIKIEALVVTRETLDGARLVNKRRKQLGLNPLKILQVPLIPADDNRRIASTRIRWGEIDRWGRAFSMQFTNYQLPITNELRNELKRPLGELLKGDPDNLSCIADLLKRRLTDIQPVMIITVGDEVTRLCNEIGIIINLAIFDFKVGRKEKYYNLSELGFKPAFTRRPFANAVRTVRNPAGNITKSLTDAIYQAIKKIIVSDQLQIVKVLGEEDLAGVPAILLSPLGSVVLYGQPGEGIVIVEVTEKIKQTLSDLMGEKLK